MAENQEQKKEDLKITVTLPTNAYFMSGVRDFTLSLIRNITNFSDQWAYRFQSVVDELCNNAIEHGSSTGQEIKLIFIHHPDESMEIMVEDSGTGKVKMKAIDIQKLVAERTKPGYPFTEIRGRGLAKIVAAWTDELTFADLPQGGLQAKIKKYLKDTDKKGIPTKPSANTVTNIINDPTHVVLTI